MVMNNIRETPTDLRPKLDDGSYDGSTRASILKALLLKHIPIKDSK